MARAPGVNKTFYLKTYEHLNSSLETAAVNKEVYLWRGRTVGYISNICLTQLSNVMCSNAYDGYVARPRLMLDLRSATKINIAVF